MNKPLATAFLIGLFPVLMFASSFGFVPLYNYFCKVTGYGGTVQKVTSLPLPSPNTTDTITVQFQGTIAKGLPWTVRPLQKQLTVPMGQPSTIWYEIQNLSSQDINGIATFNITPQKAGRFFSKLECFCYDEQTLKAQETKKLPVTFAINSSVREKKNTKDLQHVTLSYTFFKTEDFYNE